MDHSKNPEQAAAVKRLLEEGARSYVEAVTALTTYQQEVQKRCRRVMEEHIQQYGDALKVGLNSSEIENFASPELAEWEGDWASVGVRVVRRAIMPKVQYWEGYCCLGWQFEEPKFYCWMGEYYGTRRLAKDLFEKFRLMNSRVTDQYDYEVGIVEGLAIDKGSTFEEKLEELFSQWIKLWQKAGGMKQVFKT